jgi:hypothetical protein
MGDVLVGPFVPFPQQTFLSLPARG